MADNGALSGAVVTVLGGSGFLGTHLAQELLARGARLRIACRRPARAMRIRPLGDTGQVQITGCDITCPDSLARALAGAGAVVNLVGAFAGDLDAVQGTGAGRVAALARDAGARAFVHVSAIGADPRGDTVYARTKAAGEAAVLAAFPAATVLRPSVLFGGDDRFLAMFAGLAAALPVLPVFAPGARLQPLFVDDAARAVAAALADAPAHGGRIYELGGPEQVTMLELNRRIAAACRRRVLLAPLPDAVSALFAALTGWLPGAPLTRAQWRLLRRGNVVSGALPGIEGLGIAPRPLGLLLDRWMTRYRPHGRFADT